jgi:ureidoglycolate hydrolase
MHSTQTFIPMGKAPTAGEKALEDGGYYVVVVALSDSSERPDGPPSIRPTIR